MKEKLSVNKKMLGKKVQVQIGPYSYSAIVNKVVDEETFLVRDLHTGETSKVNIFDLRGV